MNTIKVTKVAQFTGHQGAIYTLCEGLNANEFYSGGNDGLVVCWNTHAPDSGKLLVKVNRPVYSLCLDEDKKLLYCGTAAGNLHVIDLYQGVELKNYEAHQNGIFDIKLTNQFLITSGGDGVVLVWDIATFQIIHQLNHSDKSARALYYDANNNWLAVGYSDYKIRIFNTHDFKLEHTINAHENSVFTLAYYAPTQELLSGGRDVMLKSWQVTNDYQPDVNIPAHTLHINHIALNHSGNLFATASMDKTIKLWKSENMQLLKVIDKARNDGHLSSVNKILWLSPTSFISAADDRVAMMWQIESSEN
ncbi:MAG: WD40 repeat domain-containing protein [Bacteroidota bacterium]